MANGEAFDDAVERARANKELGVGCHLVLVGGKCVATKDSVASLVDAGGNLPDSLPSFCCKDQPPGSFALRKSNVSFRAQIGRVRFAGIEPTHLDTHKHTHAHPRVMEALGKVAKECGIASECASRIENLRD